MEGIRALGVAGRRRPSFGLVLCLALFLAPAVYAQSAASGSLSGLVTDQQGAVVAGADVQIVDPTTNITSKTITNDAGRYIFVNVEPHKYTVTITKAGFTTHRVAQADV